MKFALLGENIGYSLSPKIHKTIYESAGLDAKYELISVSQEKLRETLEKKLREYDGFNVTKPYKQAVLPYLENSDEVKRGKIQAVNTVCVKNGLFYGYNTDVFGFSRSVQDWDFSTALVVGAGGVANAVAYSLVERGVKVAITNRTMAKADDIAENFGIKSIKISSLARHLFDLVVNCTSVGNNGEMSLPSGVALSGTRYAYDTIYSPPKTAFLLAAEEKNIITRNGLGMLIYQAIRADEIFFGKTLDYEKLYVVIERSLKKL